MLFILFFISLSLYHIYGKVERRMIEDKTIFDEIKNNISLMCRDECVGADLAAVVGMAIEYKMKSVCVVPNRVGEVWPWLENSRVKIISRFYIDGVINDDFMSDLSERISTSFRDGADGAIIYMKKRDLQKFVNEIAGVRESLFFNKSFSIALGVDDIDGFDWENVFDMLATIRTDSLTLILENDTGDKSDFVGRIFAMLNASRGDWSGVVNFALGQNILRIDQAFRLIQQIKPDTISQTEFFIDNDNI